MTSNKHHCHKHTYTVDEQTLDDYHIYSKWYKQSKHQDYLGAKFMGTLGIRSRRYKHSMPRPSLIDLVESSIVLSNDQNLILMLLSRNANEPIVQERDIGFAHGADYDGAILAHKRRGLRERVGSPFGERSFRAWGEERVRGSDPGENDAEDEDEGEEDEEASAAEERSGSLVLRVGGGQRGGIDEMLLLLLALVERHYRIGRRESWLISVGRTRIGSVSLLLSVI